MSAERFPHAEAELVANLGLARKRVREVRASTLVRGDDWSHTGGQVRYSDTGQKKLLDALRVSGDGAPRPPDPAPALQSAGDLAPKKIEKAVLSGVAVSGADFGVPAAELAQQRATDATAALQAPTIGEIRELVMVRTYPNRNIVQATHAGGHVRVRLKDSGKMIPGMVMKCAFVGNGLWRLAQPLPRWRGKW